MSKKEKEQTNSQEEQVQQEQVQAENNEQATPNGEKNWEEEYNKLNDKYIRTYSEFENFRKRTAKERIDLLSSAGAGVIKEILPILDDMERASESNAKSDDIDSVKEGFDLVQQKLIRILGAQGLKKMDAKGETFDTELHEAVTKFPAPSEDLKGKVIDVLEPGYYLNDKVVRFAKVVVGE